MKRIGYSILIGAGFALLLFALSKFVESRRKNKGGLSDALKNSSSLQESYYNAELQVTIGNTGDNIQLIEQTKEQILYRLHGSYSDISLEKIDKTNYRLKANRIFDTTVFKNAITASGKIEFSELFSISEISEPLRAIDSVLRSQDADFLTRQKKIQEANKNLDTATDKLSDVLDHNELEGSQTDHGLTKFISFTTPFHNADGSIRNPAELGHVKTKDTFHLNQIFNDAEFSRHFPENLKIVYGVKEIDLYAYDSLLDLFAKKILDPSLFPGPTGDQITDATPEVTPLGQPIISFTFNAAGTQAWYLMTERNVNKPIAIIANDVVLAAPVVESAIEGGKSNINGSFSVEETKLLCKMMLSGELPLTTRITGATFTYHSPKNFGPTLIILIVFVLASAASYGISFLINPASKP